MLIENKKESTVYIVITFFITWVCWGTLALLGIPAKESIVSIFLYLLGGLSTIIVALLLPLFVTKDKRSAYYKRFFKFRISIKWYVIPIVCVVFMVYVPYAFMFLFYRKTVVALTIQPLYMILPLFIAMIVGGGIEEFGWRGILVHNMQKMNPVFISIVVGLIWFLWHIPLFFIKGVGQYHTDFIPFLIVVIAYSFVTTSLYLESGSVVPCVILHALLNAFGELGFWYGNNQFAAYVDSIIRLVIACVCFALISMRKTDANKRRVNILNNNDELSKVKER